MAPGTTHPLHQSDGTLLSIEADDQIHVADVQTLLAHARGHQGVKTALAEPAHHLRETPALHMLLSNTGTQCKRRRICTSSCSFWVKPRTPFPADAWPMKVMTLTRGWWRFSISAISWTLSRKDEKIITRVFSPLDESSGFVEPPEAKTFNR